MIVFRIQNRLGHGPYTSNADIPDWIERHRPHWRTDDMCLPEGAYEKFRFAFKSMDDLYRWFDRNPELRTLKKEGYTVAVYRVPETSVVVGQRQVAFRATDAKMIRSANLDMRRGKRLSCYEGLLK